MVRTILIFLAFLVLLISEFMPVTLMPVALAIRFSPFLLLILLLLWSWFGNRYQSFRLKAVPPDKARYIKVLNSVAALCIIAGALLRLMHLPFSQWLVIGGLGFMSVWSYMIYRYSRLIREENPDIIDSEDEDDNEAI